jgi:hypothetical protein
MIVDPQHQMMNRYSRILNNAKGNEKGTDTHNYICDQQKEELLKKRRETRQQKKVTVDLTFKQIEARRANCRACYANLKPEQKQAIRDCQRLLYANMTAEEEHAKRNHEKAHCVIRRNTPSKNSIAMVNPLYDQSNSN